MDVLSCPWCGRRGLVWDHRYGHIVCPNCGAVVDVIYDEGPTRGSQAEAQGGTPGQDDSEAAALLVRAALRAGLGEREAVRLAVAMGVSRRRARRLVARFRG